MWSMIFRFIVIALIAAGVAWLADRPGEINIVWLGYRIEMPMLAAVFALLAVMIIIAAVWSVLRRLFFAPAAMTGYFDHRRRRKGHKALSRGIIAIGAGDLHNARRQAQIAVRNLPEEPLVRVLEAQTAQLEGDNAKVKRIFESMAASPETEVLGLRGLFNQARQAGQYDEARQIAERALRTKPELPWASNAMLAVRSATRDWPGVITIIENQKRAGLITASQAQRKRAVVETAEAMEMEQTNPDEALRLAVKAHKAAPELAPPVIVAARILASRGGVRKAMRMVEKTWNLSPHRDLADAYAHVRPGDSALDRLKRVRSLVGQTPHSDESVIALARAAMEAHEYGEARDALASSIADRPSAGICMHMAELERVQNKDRGKEREWLARAVSAPRDAAWTADGYVSDIWEPMSPVTGELDAFVWKRPVEGLSFQPTPAEPPVALLSNDTPEPEQEEPAVAHPGPFDHDGDQPPASEAPGAPPVAVQVRPSVVTAVPAKPPVPVGVPISAPTPDLETPASDAPKGNRPSLRSQPDDPGPDPSAAPSRPVGGTEWLGSALPR
ncbi:HemY protein [Rhodoligotrophos appendicifer]|uniref:heme biosynthesis protein HemY n=1 Tax=Rhodoligotrophos appendicifer TaxID=987056 RepID=UPI00117D9FF1|nr:heme biosynthesis HemY N-terminal domain-containing protein [Rhodoligotrophos appendicifer]